MRSRDELIRLAVKRLLRLLDYAPRDEAPEPAPRPEPKPRKLRQSEQPGVDMNDMLRSVPPPRPPRKASWARD